MHKKYEKIRLLLEEQETFPTTYTHKLIGKNTPRFAQCLASLEGKFPHLRRKTSRSTHSQGHLAITYVIEAETVDAIIEVLVATEQVEDLIIVL